MLNTGQPKAPSPNWIVDKSSLRSVLVLVQIQVNNHLNGSCLSGDGLTEREKKQAREWVGGEFANTDNSVFLVAVQPLKSKKHVNLQLNGLNIPFHYSDMKTYKKKKKKGPSTIWTIKTILKEDSPNITKTRQKYCSQGARRSGRARHEVTPCCGVTSAGLFWYLRAAAPAAGHSAWPRMWGTDWNA